LSKARTTYFCRECGVESSKWLGKCPSCGAWNTMVEERLAVGKSKASNQLVKTGNKPQRLSEVEPGDHPRFDLKISEFNRVLGGGIIPGSIVLLGGEPGIGKSTLALQAALEATEIATLYISGEESLEQIKLRAERIGIENDACYFVNETSLEAIVQHMNEQQPKLVIIDSIQTLFSADLDAVPGTISQIRECAGRLLRYAKENRVAVLLIGHITKDGTIAGPKILEHIVDAVLQFEGDNRHSYRILRSNKNRFGSTSELGIFEMHAQGLKQVTNPSEILIPHGAEQLSGVSIACTIDGIRPFLIEVQALVSTAAYGTPQRSSTGFDVRRLNMLLAVLEKRMGFHLASKDIFINLAGGIKITDPGIDLAVVAAILSSNLDVPITSSTCFTGEIGLTGEIRPVNRIDQRIAEAQKLGFKKMVIPAGSKLNSDIKSNLELIRVSKLDKVFSRTFSA